MQAHYVSSPSFRVYRVEGERRFSRTRNATDADKTTMRQIEVDRLQVVLRSAANSQGGLTGVDDAGYLLYERGVIDK